MQIQDKWVEVSQGVKNVLAKHEEGVFSNLEAFWEIHKLKKTQKPFYVTRSEVAMGYLISCMSKEEYGKLSKYNSLTQRARKLWEEW